MRLKVLTLDDFMPFVGKAIAVETPAATVELRLAAAQPLPQSRREGGAFRLEFEGPLETPLGQGTYAFQLEDGPTEIFIVPIGRTEAAMRYEAIFF